MEHYFTENPKSQFLKEKFEVDILGEHIIINSGSGLFSLKELDFGTKLLIENSKIPKKDARVLDLGCGYGIVGIVIKKKNPQCDVTMIDINDRAVRMAKQNCEENKVECKVFKSNIFSHQEVSQKTFDVILTNPPFSAGKNVCIEIIKQSFDHLNPEGLLQLVAPHNKGGESLKKVMLQVFGNVGELVKKSGYRVYISIKK
ncbi:MAG TPA: methyltransferase [Alphaproteobacteria bacterium]|nr:methyltransferase [Alphaproteobacteria bacterium]